MALQIPKQLDSDHDLLRKILWTLNSSAFGISDEASYNAATASIIAGGGDAGSVENYVTVSGGSSSRVGGFTGHVHATPVVSSGAAYTAGDCVGALQTIGLLRSTVNTGILQSINANDKSAQDADLDIIIFSSNPGASTFTDNAPLAIDSADVGKIMGVVQIVSGDWVTHVAGAHTAVKPNLGIVLGGTTNGLVYFAVVARSTPTYTSTTALDFRWSALQD
jgi:hypothetical protein